MDETVDVYKLEKAGKLKFVFEYVGIKYPEQGDWIFRRNTFFYWKWPDKAKVKNHIYREIL